MKIFLIVYLSVINLITFVVYGVDKSKARRGAWRIPESVLLGLAVLLGSYGALAGMLIFRHKTQKARFVLAVPALLVIETIIVILLFSRIT